MKKSDQIDMRGEIKRDLDLEDVGCLEEASGYSSSDESSSGYTSKNAEGRGSSTLGHSVSLCSNQETIATRSRSVEIRRNAFNYFARIIIICILDASG